MGEAYNSVVSICLKDLFHVFCDVVTLKTIKMSADLYWMVVRDTSSFMMKGRLSKSKIVTKAVGVAAAGDNKGVVVVTKKPKAANKPGSSTTSVTLKKGRRAVIKSVANSVSAFNKTKKRA